MDDVECMLLTGFIGLLGGICVVIALGMCFPQLVIELIS